MLCILLHTNVSEAVFIFSIEELSPTLRMEAAGYSEASILSSKLWAIEVFFVVWRLRQQVSPMSQVPLTKQYGVFSEKTVILMRNVPENNIAEILEMNSTKHKSTNKKTDK
jgi:hypothetical protein